MEAGEQIGCGIISDETEINPGASINRALTFRSPTRRRSGHLPPGQGVPETRHGHDRCHRQKSFKDVDPHHHTGVRVKTDQCAGSPSSARTQR